MFFKVNGRKINDYDSRLLMNKKVDSMSRRQLFHSPICCSTPIAFNLNIDSKLAEDDQELTLKKSFKNESQLKKSPTLKTPSIQTNPNQLFLATRSFKNQVVNSPLHPSYYNKKGFASYQKPNQMRHQCKEKNSLANMSENSNDHDSKFLNEKLRNLILEVQSVNAKLMSPLKNQPMQQNSIASIPSMHLPTYQSNINRTYIRDKNCNQCEKIKHRTECNRREVEIKKSAENMHKSKLTSSTSTRFSKCSSTNLFDYHKKINSSLNLVGLQQEAPKLIHNNKHGQFYPLISAPFHASSMHMSSFTPFGFMSYNKICNRPHTFGGNYNYVF